MKSLAILGAGGHGKVVADTALASGWERVAFFDDRWPSLHSAGDWPIVGDAEQLLNEAGAFAGVIAGIGDCQVRAARHTLLRAAAVPLVAIVHPFSWVSPRSRIGLGTVVMAGAVINVHAEVGEACIVNTGATVDHDCLLGFAVHVAPGANLAGQVIVGDRSWIGVGACVRQGVRIGSNVMVGAGAVVVADVQDGTTVAGSPAKPL